MLTTQAFHGQKELFKSEHCDWCFASTIESKCRVHSLQAYQVIWVQTVYKHHAQLLHRPAMLTFGLSEEDKSSMVLQALPNVGTNDFFARFTYRVGVCLICRAAVVLKSRCTYEHSSTLHMLVLWS